jgi:hypothetical protein
LVVVEVEVEVDQLHIWQVVQEQVVLDFLQL